MKLQSLILLLVVLCSGMAMKFQDYGAKNMVEEGYVTAGDGVRLYYQKLGDGPDLVLIPNGLYMVDDFRELAGKHTLVFYDPRNRGRSGVDPDPENPDRGIFRDVRDLEAVRRHFGAVEVALIGHSYVGLVVAMYAITHPVNVSRMVQIGSTPQDAGREYPATLSNTDGVLAEVFGRLGQIQKEPAPDSAEEACKRRWEVLRAIYVLDPADAPKLHWIRCELQNERDFMRFWTETLYPSIQKIHLAPSDLSAVRAPVLVIHGAKDRSAPYGGGRDWAMSWPDARLLTVENAAHAPWVEDPKLVLPAIEGFLGGSWPEQAQELKRPDFEDR